MSLRVQHLCRLEPYAVCGTGDQNGLLHVLCPSARKIWQQFVGEPLRRCIGIGLIEAQIRRYIGELSHMR